MVSTRILSRTYSKSTAHHSHSTATASKRLLNLFTHLIDGGEEAFFFDHAGRELLRLTRLHMQEGRL